MRKALAVAAVLAVAGFVTLTLRADEKPKNEIKDVMQKAHKDGLLKKVASGKADDSEKKDLLALYEDLSKNDPPKGDKSDWEKRTKAMVGAAKDVVDGKKGAEQKLGKTVNCMGCHQMHKP
jgi:hypothetical protein